MEHLTEEEMIGHAYGEDAGGAKPHLDGCAECAASFAELKSDLAEIERVEAPVRDEQYGARVWQAIAGTLPKYEARQRRWFSMSLMRGLSYAAVCALLVAIAFYAGRKWERHGKAVNDAHLNQQKPKQPIVVVVLGDHLDRSERLLVELKHVDAGNADMVSPLRDEARSLLTANRICRKDAAQANDPELQGALDRLDHVLTEISDQPGGLNAASIARLKNELNADGLLFEVRVLRSRARDPKPGAGVRANGGEI
jgi:hypothetical protein